MLEEELRSRKDGNERYYPIDVTNSREFRGVHEQLELSRETIKDLNHQIQLRN